MIATLLPSVGTSSAGYIQIHLPPETIFDYFDPDTMRVGLDERIAASPVLGEEKHLQAGSGMVAGKQSSQERFMFLRSRTIKSQNGPTHFSDTTEAMSPTPHHLKV